MTGPRYRKYVMNATPEGWCWFRWRTSKNKAKSENAGVLRSAQNDNKLEAPAKDGGASRFVYKGGF